VRAWRLCRKPHAAEPLSGKGGTVVAGRWHEKGSRIVYTSATLSLAALELLVHAGVGHAPSDLVAIEIEIPDDLKILELPASALPRDWRAIPAPRRLKQLGTKWLEEKKSAVLRVPSAVVPTESNFLLNPLHPDAKRIAVAGTTPFKMDPRLIPKS
jgi:RES domain-containing protein